MSEHKTALADEISQGGARTREGEGFALAGDEWYRCFVIGKYDLPDTWPQVLAASEAVFL